MSWIHTSDLEEKSKVDMTTKVKEIYKNFTSQRWPNNDGTKPVVIHKK